ncbi:MAG: methyltransferase domain-containing protein, partial [Planctomycetes bacterium]|nr:methyltransferase domain-containing protein [Planctomycetota bacterium]
MRHEPLLAGTADLDRRGRSRRDRRGGHGRAGAAAAGGPVLPDHVPVRPQQAGADRHRPPGARLDLPGGRCESPSARTGATLGRLGGAPAARRRRRAGELGVRAVSRATRLPFDQYQRYRLVADIVGRLRPRRARLSILDVGGRTGLLRLFLPRARVTAVDLEPCAGTPRLVLGSGAELPFADRSFDLVCAFDTLEHVPPRHRSRFVRECARVSRAWVVLAGPYASARVRSAEALLQRFLKEKLELDHRYLREHAAYGLPERASVERALQRAGAQTAALGHANLERWLALMCVAMTLEADPALRSVAPALYDWYNRSLYASDHAEPVYRHAVVAALHGARLPDLKGLLAPARAPRGALEPFAKLTHFLSAFDAQRGAWKHERAQFERSVAELRADLDGHRAALAEARSELARARHVLAEASKVSTEHEKHAKEQAAVIAALEKDLAGHKSERAELHKERKEAAKVLAEHEKRAKEQAAVIAALQQDLAGHKSERAELHKERKEAAKVLAEHEKRAKEQAAVIAALQQDLAGHKSELAELHKERKEAAKVLAEHEKREKEQAAVIAALGQDLAGHKSELAELHKERKEAAKVLAEHEKRTKEQAAA